MYYFFLSFYFLFTPLIGPQTTKKNETLRQVEHTLPNLGFTIWETRKLDPGTGKIIRRATDSHDKDVDLDSLLLAERKLRIAKNGKISPELIQKIDSVGSNDLVSVVFWLLSPKLDLVRMFQDEVDQGNRAEIARLNVADFARNIFIPKNTNFANRLRESGFEVTLIGSLIPNVIAKLPAKEISHWAKEPEVDLAYLVFEQGAPELNLAQGTMRTLNVHEQGITGATGPTKVLVNDCGNIPPHPALPPIINALSVPDDFHATGVAGNIAADNGKLIAAAAKGIPQIYNYGKCNDDIGAQMAWNWGISQGISVGNVSWGNGNKCNIVFLDRYFDYIIRNFNVMMFKSTGNEGITSSPCSTSPGNGFNMTNTGAYTDRNTFDWADDFMANYSSYQNPIEGHEKPELAAPGAGVITTTLGGRYQRFNGTSSASPLTCGVGVLLGNQDPTILSNMTTMKAALMVGAWHNVEGARPVSDKDGAGGVHAAASHAVIRDGQFESGVFSSSSFTGGIYDKQIQLLGGDETRVIVLWFSDPDSAYTQDILKMELDLTILDPNGNPVASAADPFSAWDLVEFIPPVTGTYTVRLTLQRFLGTSEPYTIAWSTRQDAAVADVSFTGTPMLGTTLQVNFRERYDANSLYIGFASLSSLPNFFPLPGGWIVPVELDLLAIVSSGRLPGFLGALDNNGLATGLIPIPQNPVFMGLQVWVAMSTFKVSPLVIRGTSPATSFVIQ